MWLKVVFVIKLSLVWVWFCFSSHIGTTLCWWLISLPSDSVVGSTSRLVVSKMFGDGSDFAINDIKKFIISSPIPRHWLIISLCIKILHTCTCSSFKFSLSLPFRRKILYSDAGNFIDMLLFCCYSIEVLVVSPGCRYYIYLEII